MGKIDEKYIVNIKGKDFVTFAGLLNALHKENTGFQLLVRSISVDWDKQSAYCVAYCKIGDIEVEGVGSGTQQNCGPMVKDHYIEMAQTRAKARALRDALNVSEVCSIELGDNPVINEESINQEPNPRPRPAGDGDKDDECADCGAGIPPVVSEYSLKYFDRKLCRNCQEKEKEKK